MSNRFQIDSTGYDQILQARRIAVFITDLDQIIMNGKGDMEVMSAVLHEQLLVDNALNQIGPPPFIGQSIWAIIPELTSYEMEVASILGEMLPALDLHWINRTQPIDPKSSLKADPATLYLDVTVRPYRQQTDSTILGLLFIVEDTTDSGVQHQQIVQTRNDLFLIKDQLQQHSQDLTIANAELAHGARTKSQFVSVAAHELRTPLAAITGYVDLLLDGMFGPLNDEQTQFLNIVLNSARRLLDITNNLLDVTMIESGHIELVLNPVDLAQLIKRVALELHPIYQGRDQDLTAYLEEDLSPAMIDETRTFQILSNLISNASKYTPQGGQITINLHPSDTPGFAQIAIQDTGVGIPPEDQKRMFSRFFRASSAQLVNASGAGLGLHITQHLVELHGGHIWFESLPGQGTTFYVTLPLWEDE
ncbi:MAG: HAMP domain-containing histidine kinase [Caldilineaceae bacterium]|nr:HAMP domain-containing histidine kinase [Caldilineaceae bacterium]MBP8122703.1 HAMP domain-containing histidine kinase [Caldilineaceae bacterium]